MAPGHTDSKVGSALPVARGRRGPSRRRADSEPRSRRRPPESHVVRRKKPANTARENNSDSAEFCEYELEAPFASGRFFLCAKGEYSSGVREGEPCVCKWFKTGCVYEEAYFDNDMRAARQALALVDKWNTAGFIRPEIRVNMPEVWCFEPDSVVDGEDWGGRKVLQEPFIVNYQKFNSNTGWANTNIDSGKVMQALSHYSYHISRGRYLLCDLQGGLYPGYGVLTDPVVMSMERCFGPTDLGAHGISSFFHRHKCNRYCRDTWLKPADTTAYHTCRYGSTMESTTLGGTRTGAGTGPGTGTGASSTAAVRTARHSTAGALEPLSE